MEVKNKKPEFWTRIIAGLLLTGSIIFLIVRRNSEGASIKGAVWMTAIFGAFFIISMFGKKLYQLSEKLRDKERSQNALTSEEIKEIVLSILNEWGIYIKKGTVMIQRTKIVGNNIIYVNYIQLYRKIVLHDSETNKKVETDMLYILVNGSKTTNERRPQVLDGRCGRQELEEGINDMADNPRIPRSVQETELINDPFGRPQQKTKITSFTQEDEKKEDNVE